MTARELPPDTLLALSYPQPACSPAERRWLLTRYTYGLRLTERHTAALRMADSLLADDGLSIEDRAKLTAYRGRSLYSLGRYAASIAPLDSARTIYDEKAFPKWTIRAELLANAAWARLASGQTDAAYCQFIEARDMIHRECRAGCRDTHTRDVLSEVRKGIMRVWSLNPEVNPLRCGSQNTGIDLRRLWERLLLYTFLAGMIVWRYRRPTYRLY